MTYPNGRTIDYSYGSGMSNSNAALDQAVGRLDAIVDGSNSGDAGQVLEQYSYLGLSTIVARNHPQTGINLTLVGSSGSIGSGGDQYVGLDQFGRVVDQNWINTTGTTNTTVDGYTYTYDSNGNVLSKTNVLDSAYSETYTYDSLNRLTAVTRGGASYQSWNLDTQGNWNSFTSSGTVQTRTANAQNQITTVSGLLSPAYDSNGNMVTDQTGDTLIYDAWNRLVEVKNSAGAVIAQYTYNAQGYAVTATYPQGTSQLPPGTTNYLYYTSSWQLIEVRTGGTAATNVTVQMVWSAAYINAPVLQDTYSVGVIQPNSRLYFIQDANWNTTAVVGYNATTQTWGVVQRYVYSPYGNIIILNPNFTTAPSGTTPMVNNLYQGMPLDPVTGLYYERARWYSPSLGTWISQDPLQYINGADTYQFVISDPVDRVDPEGTNFWDYVGYIFTGQLGPAPTIPIYVVDRSGGVNTGLTGGHIDMVLPGQGVVGFYGRIPHGAGSGQQDGWNIPGFWNHTYQQFERNRPRYINPPRGAGCPHSSDSGYKSTIAAIRVAPAQLQEMLQKLNSLEQHPGTFNIATNNCAENACKVLNAGGLNPDPWYDFGFDNPQGLIDQLQQGGATVFTGYTVENVNGQVTIIPAGQPPQP